MGVFLKIHISDISLSLKVFKHWCKFGNLNESSSRLSLLFQLIDKKINELKIYEWSGRSPSAAWANCKSCRCRTLRWIGWVSSPFPDCTIWRICTWPTIRSAASRSTPSPEPLPSACWCSPTTPRCASIPPLFQVFFFPFFLSVFYFTSPSPINYVFFNRSPLPWFFKFPPFFLIFFFYERDF